MVKNLKKIFFQNFFFNKKVKKILFSKQMFNNFLKTSIFFQKKFISKKIFFQKNNFFKLKLFPKNRFSNKNVLKIKMLIFLKLFIRHMSRRNVRIENAGKRAAVEKSRAVIGWKRINERASFACNVLSLYTNSFCRQRAELVVLIKSNFKSR